MEKIELKHTSGPWHPVQYARWWNIQPDEFYGDPNLLDTEECPQAEANARLASVAPDMISVLIEAVEKDNSIATAYEAIGHGAKYVRPSWYEKAVAAIAKATNTTQP